MQKKHTALAVVSITRTLLIHPDMSDIDREHGFANINGPSLVRVPEWVENPLGKYYLYFAHHRGTYIRLAYADEIEGPYTVYRFGTLHRDNTVFRRCDHIASPDVHINEENRRFIMYFHGNYRGGQATCWATSPDGIYYTATESLEKQQGPYFRVFGWKGLPYATNHNMLNRGKTAEWTTVFERRAAPLFPGEPGKGRDGTPRHTANYLVGDTLTVYYSLYGDTPERILKSTVELTEDWNDWHPSPPTEVIAPKYDFEGVDIPIVPSTNGLDRERVHQLRDPDIYCEDGETWLLYSVAGEQGIAIMKLSSE